jgi:hypothetical protein
MIPYEITESCYETCNEKTGGWDLNYNYLSIHIHLDRRKMSASEKLAEVVGSNHPTQFTFSCDGTTVLF